MSGRLRAAAGVGRGALGELAAEFDEPEWLQRAQLAREWPKRKLTTLRAEIAGANPTPLERLLADRVVTCWWHLHHREAIYAGREYLSLDLGAYYQRSISAAHKRYLSAIKTLAVVRKLAVPVLQVNIARKQVTVAATSAVPSEG